MNRYQSVHVLGMGCWQLGGTSSLNGRINGYGAIDKDMALATVHEALEQGIRFYDTAASYGHGRSEELLGEGLGNRRSEVTICTKFGMRKTRSGEWLLDFSPSHTDQAINEALGRLGTNHIEILLLHGPPDDTNWHRFDRSALEKAKAEGRIGGYGVSVRSMKGARNAVVAGFGRYIEVVMNALDRRAGSLRERMDDQGQQLIARAPLASGLLTDRLLTLTPSFPPDDIRSTFPPEQLEWVAKAVRSLGFLSSEPGGLATSALRYILFHPAVDRVIPGMRSPAQAQRNRKAFDLGPLRSELIDRIETTVPEVYSGWR
ncbi:MAG: aldo/keto reductase [Flavobacteriales bacterium]|nr:aldo/keto reductase [Flavobacteriales bacterium]MCB0808074.1 aldo/keto reductase [Flavobacteriales bacterium]